jgi:hypothetical protein
MVQWLLCVAWLLLAAGWLAGKLPVCLPAHPVEPV